MSETFNKSQLSEFFDVSAGCSGDRITIVMCLMFTMHQTAQSVKKGSVSVPSKFVPKLVVGRQDLYFINKIF